MESENLSLLIRLSVSDGQKTDSSKDVSFIRYIIKPFLALLIIRSLHFVFYGKTMRHAICEV